MKGLQTSKSKTNKIISAMITAAVMVATAAVHISADNVNTVNNSIFTLSMDPTRNIEYLSTGTTYSIYDAAPFGFVTGFEVALDTTYTITFTAKLDTDNGNSFSKDISTVSISRTFISDGSSLANVYRPSNLDNFVITSSHTNTSISYSITFNSTQIQITPAGLRYFYFWIFNDDNPITFSLSSFTVKSVYDPGGEVIDYLREIYSYGSNYTLPEEAALSLDSSVKSMHQAESTIIEKANSLISSVSDSWESNKTSVKEFSKSIKPAAAQMNNLFLTIQNSLPTEIKVLFVVIPMLLFIGWLIGRIDK